jgi:predicted GIY-YIG superfamily endonuclease
MGTNNKNYLIIKKQNKMVKKNQKTKWYVYIIVNQKNEIEYVGCTYNAKKRFVKHIKTKPINKFGRKNYGSGKFYGRDDIRMEITKEFNTRREAFDYEADLKTYYGFEITERRGSKLMPLMSVKAYCSKTGKELGIYPSISEAARQCNVGFRSVSSSIKGRVKVVDKKYTFKEC